MFSISSKTAKTVFILAVSLIIILGTLLFVVVYNYSSTPFSPVFEGKEEYALKNDLLLKLDENGEPDTKSPAVFYLKVTGDFHVCEPKSLDLSKFGFSGTMDYYMYTSKTVNAIFPMYDLYYRFARLNSISSLIYEDESGKKYILHPLTQSSPTPTVEKFFSRSYGNEDVYGTKMQAVSADGFTAAGIEDDILYVSFFNSVKDSEEDAYRGDKAYSLKELGLKDCEAKFFINEKHLWLIATSPEGVRGNYIADAYEGKVAPCPEVTGVKFSEELMSNYYAPVIQNEENSKDKKTDKYVYAECCNVVTGNVITAILPKSEFSSADIVAVSNRAGHFVLECTKNGESTSSLYAYGVKNGKQGKYADLSSLVADGDKIKNVYFIYDNILAVTFENIESKNTFTNIYKINF